MKPLEVNSNKESCGDSLDMLDAEELYSILGLVIVEGRIPAQNAKGRCIGPHAYRPEEASVDHVCDNSNQCIQASVYRDQFSRLGHHGSAMLIQTLLYPSCTDHPAQSSHSPVGGCLLEQWIIKLVPKRQYPDSQPESVTTLLQTILSYLHFSQLSIWLSETEGYWPPNIQYKISSSENSLHESNEIGSSSSFTSTKSYSFPVVSVGESNNYLEVSLNALCKSWSEVSLNCLQCRQLPLLESNSDNFNNNSECLPQSPQTMKASSDACQDKTTAEEARSETVKPTGNLKRPVVPSSMSVDSVVGLSSKNKRPNSIFQSMSKSKSSKFSSLKNANKSQTEKEEQEACVKSSKCRKSMSEHEAVFQLQFHKSPYRETLVSPMVLYSDDADSQLPLFHSHGVVALPKLLNDRLTEDLTPYPRKETLEEVISDFSQMKMKQSTLKSPFWKVDKDNNNVLTKKRQKQQGQDAKNKREGNILICESLSVGCYELNQKSPKKCLKLDSDKSVCVGHHVRTNLSVVRRSSHEIDSEFIKSRLTDRRSRPRCSEANFNYRTRLPLQSSPAPLKRNLTGKFDFDGSVPCLKIARSASTPEFEDNDDNIIKDSKQFLSSSAPVNSSRNRLVVNFEESMLNCRIQPVGSVDGFSLEIGASGDFCPPHLRLPMAAYFFHLSDDNAPSPYLGHVDLTQLSNKRGYHIPKKGSLQLTLFNPNGTVLKMFVVVYDLSDMPPNSKTFLRQRTIYTPISMTTATFQSQMNAWTSSRNPFSKSKDCNDDETPHSETTRNNSSNEALTLPAYLRYLVHLRFHTAKSGKMYLHSDVRLIFSRDKFEFDPRIATYELRSFIEAPQNPRYSPKK